SLSRLAVQYLELPLHGMEAVLDPCLRVFEGSERTAGVGERRDRGLLLGAGDDVRHEAPYLRLEVGGRRGVVPRHREGVAIERGAGGARGVAIGGCGELVREGGEGLPREPVLVARGVDARETRREELDQGPVIRVDAARRDGAGRRPEVA